MTDRIKIYWDSCIWLSLINDELGRAARCKHVIARAVLGELEIWTSALTLAEVFKSKCENKSAALPDNKDLEFEQYVQQDFLILVQIDQEVGTKARKLLREHPELKKPADGLHLASALINNIDEFHTFDEVNLIPLSGKVERSDGKTMTICPPPEPPPPAQTTPSLFDQL